MIHPKFVCGLSNTYRTEHMHGTERMFDFKLPERSHASSYIHVRVHMENKLPPPKTNPSPSPTITFKWLSVVGPREIKEELEQIIENKAAGFTDLNSHL